MNLCFVEEALSTVEYIFDALVDHTTRKPLYNLVATGLTLLKICRVGLAPTCMGERGL